MNGSRPASFWIIVASFLTALLADMIALPGSLDRIWPSWVTLVLIYWCIRLPHRFGVIAGWLIGLLVDVADSTLMGQHALALALVAYLTHKTHRRLILSPVWQQALTVAVFVLIDRLLVFWINGMIGYPPADGWFLLPTVSSLLAWPLLLWMLSDLGRQPQIERL